MSENKIYTGQSFFSAGEGFKPPFGAEVIIPWYTDIISNLGTSNNNPYSSFAVFGSKFNRTKCITSTGQSISTLDLSKLAKMFKDFGIDASYYANTINIESTAVTQKKGIKKSCIKSVIDTVHFAKLIMSDSIDKSLSNIPLNGKLYIKGIFAASQTDPCVLASIDIPADGNLILTPTIVIYPPEFDDAPVFSEVTLEYEIQTDSMDLQLVSNANYFLQRSSIEITCGNGNKMTFSFKNFTNSQGSANNSYIIKGIFSKQNVAAADIFDISNIVFLANGNKNIKSYKYTLKDGSWFKQTNPKSPVFGYDLFESYRTTEINTLPNLLVEVEVEANAEFTLYIRSNSTGNKGYVSAGPAYPSVRTDYNGYMDYYDQLITDINNVRNGIPFSSSPSVKAHTANNQQSTNIINSYTPVKYTFSEAGTYLIDIYVTTDNIAYENDDLGKGYVLLPSDATVIDESGNFDYDVIRLDNRDAFVYTFSGNKCHTYGCFGGRSGDHLHKYFIPNIGPNGYVDCELLVTGKNSASATKFIRVSFDPSHDSAIDFENYLKFDKIPDIDLATYYANDAGESYSHESAYIKIPLKREIWDSRFVDYGNNKYDYEYDLYGSSYTHVYWPVTISSHGISSSHNRRPVCFSFFSNVKTANTINYSNSATGKSAYVYNGMLHKDHQYGWIQSNAIASGSSLIIYGDNEAPPYNTHKYLNQEINIHTAPTSYIRQNKISVNLSNRSLGFTNGDVAFGYAPKTISAPISGAYEISLIPDYNYGDNPNIQGSMSELNLFDFLICVHRTATSDNHTDYVPINEFDINISYAD